MVIIGPLVEPEEGLVKKLDNVEMKINQTQMNVGTLYITENYLRWQETGREEGISIAWESITLHAISNEPNVKCIYIMLDVHIDYPRSQGNGHDERMAQDGDIEEDDDDEGTCEDEEPPMTEIWYTPHDENRIEEIFEAMKHCQSLHPDPNDSFSEEEDEEFIMAEENNHAEDDLQNLHIDDDERFADAEEN
ncbi:methylosome subunit pICln [Contarinia nasturtii]|uniref:methylosome subunit pICln n=1 Tax=Contarinia nasturtii TaxID=265458 RepID=UPI0012D3A87E|nr:methylosome subunit pICln [Contarinia nasturtii]